MDDVLLLETKPKEKQELLDNTEKEADKYLIKLRKEKKPNPNHWQNQRLPKFTLREM